MVIAFCAFPALTQAATPMPTITTIKLTNGAYKTTINGKKVTLKPFSGYTGAVWAKRVNFGANLGLVYLFVPQASGTPSILKYYDTFDGKMRSLTPFFGNHTLGYNVTIAVQASSKKVYLAFGTKAVGASTRVIEITRKGNNQVNNPTVADTEDKGQVIVQFLKIYGKDYGLATMIADNPATLKVWKYSKSTSRFDEDTAFDKNVIKTANNTLSL